MSGNYVKYEEEHGFWLLVERKTLLTGIIFAINILYLVRSYSDYGQLAMNWVAFNDVLLLELSSSLHHRAPITALKCCQELCLFIFRSTSGVI